MSKRVNKVPGVVINIFFCICSLMFIIPFILIISASFTDEQALLDQGYKLIPSEFSLEAYKYVFRNPQQLIDSYKVTIIFSFVSTVLAVIVMSLLAYPLSRPNYKYKKPIMFFIFFTMLFSGGLVPTYIWITRYLHLGDTIWVYILPYLVNAFNVVVIRTFFQGLPVELTDAAKIDGASEMQTFFKIMLPLCKPAMLTSALLTLMTNWKDLLYPLLLTRSTDMRTLPAGLALLAGENIFAYGPVMAGAVISIVPLLIVYIVLQKYFVQGTLMSGMKE